MSRFCIVALCRPAQPVIREHDPLFPGLVAILDRLPQRDFLEPTTGSGQFKEFGYACRGHTKAAVFLTHDHAVCRQAIQRLTQRAVSGVILLDQIFQAQFAAQLGNIVRTGNIRTWEIVAIIVGDLVWVAGSIVLGALYFRSFTLIGAVLVDAVALAVLVFAIMQIRGLRIYRQVGP